MAGYSAMKHNANQILFYEMIHNEEHAKLFWQQAVSNHNDSSYHKEKKYCN